MNRESRIEAITDFFPSTSHARDECEYDDTALRTLVGTREWVKLFCFLRAPIHFSFNFYNAYLL